MEAGRTPLIDIHAAVKSKSPKLYKRLPGFVLNYIKKIIRQDELNAFIKLHNDETGIDFLRSSFDYFNVKAKVLNPENFPENTRVIVVANHPVGSFDGLHIIDACYRKYGTVKALVNDLLLNVKNLNEFFMGVDKYGSMRRQSMDAFTAVFKSDSPVVIFPAGLVSRRSKGVIKDLEWKKTFVKLALKYERDIVPVHITGRVSNKFYFVANARKFLKIKTNPETFLLPQEILNQKNAFYEISIGKTIPYSRLDSGCKDFETAQKIKDYVYEIGKDIDADLDSFLQ